MYKCSECSQTYQQKPDYCDCGNDSFIEINEEKTSKIIEASYKKNLPSLIFLICCIVLSFIILFFIANPKSNEVKSEQPKENKAVDLPDIDKIWNDEKPKQIVSKPVQIQNQIKKEPVITKNPQENIIKKEEKPAVKKQPQIISAPKQNKAPVIQKAKTVQKSPVTAQTKPADTKIQAPQPPQTPKQTIQKATPQTQTVTQPNIQISNPEEMKQYKKALRSKIASNIDFLSVAGDGKCSLTFNVSQSGALLNRKFVSQSQNMSLNDAVYQGMLKVSSFKAPPSGYKNETLKLTVQITGGNFSVSLE